jgi:hypothetical protein
MFERRIGEPSGMEARDSLDPIPGETVGESFGGGAGDV